PHHLEAEVEPARRLPGGMAEVERHRDHALRVARNQVHLGREIRERALVVERPVHGVDAADVEQLAGAFQMVERRIQRGHPVSHGVPQVPSRTNVTCTVARYSAILPSSTAAFSLSTSMPVMPRSVLLARSSALRTASSQLWGDAPITCVMRATAMLLPFRF